MPELWHGLPIRNRFAAAVLLLLTLACVAFIWGNSLDSTDASLEKSGWAERFTRPALLALPIPSLHTDEAVSLTTRKLAHFAEFFLLGALSFGFVLALGRPLRLRGIWVAAFCVSVAISDELLQFLSSRGPMVSDVLLDAAGSACGLGAVAGSSRLCGKVRGQDA